MTRRPHRGRTAGRLWPLSPDTLDVAADVIATLLIDRCDVTSPAGFTTATSPPYRQQPTWTMHTVDVPCLIEPHASHVTDAAGEQTSRGLSDVTMPVGVDVAEGRVLHIRTAGGTPHGVFEVIDVVASSTEPTRRVTVRRYRPITSEAS